MFTCPDCRESTESLFLGKCQECWNDLGRRMDKGE